MIESSATRMRFLRRTRLFDDESATGVVCTVPWAAARITSGGCRIRAILLGLEHGGAGDVPHVLELRPERLHEDLLFAEDPVDGEGDALVAGDRARRPAAAPMSSPRGLRGRSSTSCRKAKATVWPSIVTVSVFSTVAMSRGSMRVTRSTCSVGSTNRRSATRTTTPARRRQRGRHDELERGAHAGRRPHVGRAAELFDLLLDDGQADAAPGHVGDDRVGRDARLEHERQRLLVVEAAQLVLRARADLARDLPHARAGRCRRRRRRSRCSSLLPSMRVTAIVT